MGYWGILETAQGNSQSLLVVRLEVELGANTRIFLVLLEPTPAVDGSPLPLSWIWRSIHIQMSALQLDCSCPLT